jgi:hypothetical protein
MSYERRYAPLKSAFPEVKPPFGGYLYHANVEFQRGRVTTSDQDPPDPPTGFEPGDIWVKLETKD